MFDRIFVLEKRSFLCVVENYLTWGPFPNSDSPSLSTSDSAALRALRVTSAELVLDCVGCDGGRTLDTDWTWIPASS